MVDAGLIAYPVLLATACALLRVGRREEWGAFEWLRLATLACLFGLIVAVQVMFALLGFASSPAALLTGIFTTAGLALLLELYIWERWQVRVAQAASENASA